MDHDYYLPFAAHSVKEADLIKRKRTGEPNVPRRLWLMVKKEVARVKSDGF